MFDVLERITELRNERGWSSYRVAKNAGIPNSTFSTWYSRNASPTLEGIEKICDAFDITLSEFFYQEKNELHNESKIAVIRKDRGLSLEELAIRSGVAIEYLTAFESKKMKLRNASYDMVESIADALECSPDEIVERE